MSKYKKLKMYYDSGLWDDKRLKNAVIKKWITEEEFKNITGYSYTEDDLAELQALIDEKNTPVEVSEPPAEITETDELPIFPTEADTVTDEAVSEPQTEG